MSTNNTTKSAPARGGRRPGAGRPKGSGNYGEVTHPVRVPVSMIEAVRSFVAAGGEGEERGIPLFGTAVRAGLPTFTDDHVEARLDLHTHLVPHPQTTFFVRVQGDSMENAGIQDGDLLVVDRSLPAREHAIIIAALDGELTVKRLRYQQGQPQLVPENDRYKVITIEPDQDFHIWGVVTSVIHKV